MMAAMSRSPRTRLVPLALVMAMAMALTACGHGSGDDSSSPAAPEWHLKDLHWSVPEDLPNIRTCGDVAVYGTTDQTPEIVHPASGRVSTPQRIKVPPHSAARPKGGWLISATCQDDVRGRAIVIVEAQQKAYDAKGLSPVLYVGFATGGKQLWAYAGARGMSEDNDYVGVGAFEISDPDTGDEVVIDSRTGRVLGRMHGDGTTAPQVLTPDRLLLGTSVIDPDGHPVGTIGGRALAVDGGRFLVDTDAGLAMVRASDLQPLWTALGVSLGPSAQAVDDSTGMVVATSDSTHTVVGLHLDSGDVAWTSSVRPPSRINGVDAVGGGVASLPNDGSTSQILVSTRTGKRLPTHGGRWVIPGPRFLLALDAAGVPRRVTLSSLK